jgi:hypothetical protein
MTNPDSWRAAYRRLSAPELGGLVAAFAEARRLGGTVSLCDERLEALRAELFRRERLAFAEE